jgi:hypothetical protein
MGLTQAAESTTIPADVVEAYGVSSDCFRYAMYRVRTGASITEIKTRVLFWDGVLEKFVADPNVAEQTFSGTSLNGQFTFETLGRKFYVLITSVTGSDTIDIEVSGFGYSATFD